MRKKKSLPKVFLQYVRLNPYSYTPNMFVLSVASLHGSSLVMRFSMGFGPFSSIFSEGVEVVISRKCWMGCFWYEPIAQALEILLWGRQKPWKFCLPHSLVIGFSISFRPFSSIFSEGVHLVISRICWMGCFWYEAIGKELEILFWGRQKVWQFCTPDTLVIDFSMGFGPFSSIFSEAIQVVMTRKCCMGCIENEAIPQQLEITL